MMMKIWKALTFVLAILCIGQALYIHRGKSEPVAGVKALYVIDGDTFAIDGKAWSPYPDLKWKVRILGIDAPEIHGKCPAERQAAQEAKTRLRAILASNNNDVMLTQVHHDKYGGRLLATVTVKGDTVENILLREHLVMGYTGHGPKTDWCEVLK